MNTEMKIGGCLILLATHGFAWHLGVNGYFTEKPRPCIVNYHDANPIYDILQEELNDVDDTPQKKEFHDAIESSFGDDVFVDKYGTKYLVPSTCKVDYNGFSVILWQKTWKELTEEK